MKRIRGKITKIFFLLICIYTLFPYVTYAQSKLEVKKINTANGEIKGEAVNEELLNVRYIDIVFSEKFEIYGNQLKDIVERITLQKDGEPYLQFLDPYNSSIIEEDTLRIYFKDGHRGLEANGAYRLFIPWDIVRSKKENGYIYNETFILYFKVGKRQMIYTHPRQNSFNVDVNSLHTLFIGGKNYSFMELVYQDINNEYTFEGLNGLDIIKNSIVQGIGKSSANRIDESFLDYLFTLSEEEKQNVINLYLTRKNIQQQTTSIFIPIKILEKGMTYEVTLQKAEKQPIYKWYFVTKGVEKEKLPLKAILLEYDSTTPLILQGKDFVSGEVSVTYNDKEAYKVNVLTSNVLEVYLAKPGEELSSGVYEIVVKKYKKPKVSYGFFKLIAKKEIVPNEEKNLIQKEDPYGIMEKDKKRSKDIFYMQGDFKNKPYLFYELDELFTQEPSIRSLVYEGYSDFSIKKWELVSFEYDMILKNAKILSTKKPMKMKVGKVPFEEEEQLVQKLWEQKPVSSWISLQFENGSFEEAVLRISFENTKRKDLSVYRYDPETRRFYEVEEITVNTKESWVEFTTKEQGIYVVTQN